MAADRLPRTSGTTSERGSAWAVAPGVAWALTDGGGAAVMHLAHGVPLLLSPTGHAVWDVLVGGRTPEDDLTAAPPSPLSEEAVAAETAAAFGLAPEDVAADVGAFLAMLEQHGVVVRVGGVLPRP
ncbi:hypothetical protein GCM10022241_06180 [Micrococcus endophyticus]